VESSWGLLIAIAATLIASTAGAAAGAGGPADDREASAGHWDVAAVEWEGNQIDQEWLARLRVVYQADGSWAVFLRRFPVAEGKSTNRQDVTPKTFEMETLGSEGIKPTRFHGIYRLDGDIRTLCIAREDAPRPDEFTAPRNSGRMLVTLRRPKDSPGGRSPRSRPKSSVRHSLKPVVGPWPERIALSGPPRPTTPLYVHAGLFSRPESRHGANTSGQSHPGAGRLGTPTAR
jgi:uncharacterized protein (TIGR03067 family)